MIIGLNLDQTLEFISKFDPDKGVEGGNPTVFTLNTLDSRVMGHLRDLSTKMAINPSASKTDDVETTIAMNDVAFQVVQFGLGGAAPFQDEEKHDIPFAKVKRHLRGKSYSIVSEEIVNRLPLNVIAELSDELRKLNNLGDDEGNA